ncbi:MAG: 50S ribosome-binding GTPase [Candidatus Hydrogenedentes bacterium]|nr:50S ribosome-binding GTPase [Candidatus Hydrogenedentota bacterium]
MPTNLPPEYFDAEERFRDAKSPQEKIVCLEELLSTVPKHKGTDKLRADLRRKLSKLKAGLETAKKTGRHKSVYHIEREGPVQVLVIGAPNVGKSALVAALTHATPKVSEYPFTTWTPAPGMMAVRDIHIQLVDTPPLSEEHIEPELFNLVRSADFLLLVVDLQSRPLVQIDSVIALLDTHRIALEGTRADPAKSQYLAVIPCLVLANKCDDEAWDEEFAVLRELIGERWPLLPVSAASHRNLDRLGEILFERLELMRVYCKLPHKDADMGAPFVLKKGGTVLDFAGKVHKDFVEGLTAARVWGPGVHDGQHVGRDHVLYDGDIVELHV